GEVHEREFVYNITHALKSPLAAQIGIVETLQRHARRDLDWLRQLYSRLRIQCFRLNQTDADILSLASVDAATHSSRGIIDLRCAVKPAIESAEALAQLCGVRLDISLPDEPLLVLADENEISMLILNLLSNAVNYNRT